MLGCWGKRRAWMTLVVDDYPWIFSRRQAHVKRGGVLVYATCSLLAQENEAVAAWFLREYGDRFRALDWGDGPVSACVHACVRICVYESGCGVGWC